MTSIEDDQATIVSQQAPAVVTQILTEQVDVSQMGGPSLSDFIAQHGDMEDAVDSQESQALTVAAHARDVTFAAAATTAGPPTKKRKRMAFANKKLLGHRELFLSCIFEQIHG